MMRSFGPCVGAAILAAPSALYAQALPASFTMLQQQLGNVATSRPQDELLVTRIGQEAYALQVASTHIKPADQAEFAQSLGFNAELLGRAAHSDNADAVQILADVADDLEVKRLSATGMAASSSFPGRVKVKVTTKRNNAVAPGYTVTLSPVRWNRAEPMYRLATLSPASGQVAPGRYQVAALLNNQVKAQQIFRVGLDAEDETDIELPVPAQ